MVTPDRGDLIWIDFDPARGREQKHHRPALVISPHSYNKYSKLILVCPITSNVRKYAFGVPIEHTTVAGMILVDQIKAFDWKDRDAKRIGTSDLATVEQVLHKLQLLIS